MEWGKQTVVNRNTQQNLPVLDWHARGQFQSMMTECGMKRCWVVMGAGISGFPFRAPRLPRIFWIWIPFKQGEDLM